MQQRGAPRFDGPEAGQFLRRLTPMLGWPLLAGWPNSRRLRHRI